MKPAKIPSMIYGTAWKEAATAELVKQSITAGFRAIDTANQKKHYREDFVGDALHALKSEGIQRGDLFLQSKYTYQQGQDHRLPYNPADDFGTQVRSSFASTLKNLHTDYIDSYLLHGPSAYEGMMEADWEVWAAMETLQQSGQIRMIGISNTGINHLKALCENPKVKVRPQVVQNRCFAARGWDKEVREYCSAHKIIYQGFSLLTANQQVWFDPRVTEIAVRTGLTPEQVLFRFSVQIGILPITGTTDPEHMKLDLESVKPGAVPLSAADLQLIHSIS